MSGLERLGEPVFERIAIIGVGLIGSSVARAARECGGARSLVAYDRDAGVRAMVRELGIVDAVAESAAEAVSGADLVVLAVPVGACGAVAAEISTALGAGAILTDVGSVKASVARDVSPHVPAHAIFIPGHPIAGTEHSGPEAGFASLFRGRWWVLTPLDGKGEEAAGRLAALVTAFGSKVETMDVAHHDLVLAVTSHLPHLIAYNIVGTASDFEAVVKSEVIKFSASGFRDFTRLAASDPVMWRDVFLNNREAVLEMLGRFSEDLSALQRMIRSGDGNGLLERFTETRAIRKAIIEAGQDTAAPDFGRLGLGAVADDGATGQPREGGRS
ncbi:MAG: prephenate/arogenate dehydrogenase family protein [Rhizobiales bacterium]|nr:prephenate/arogenate dehydrogenase family protein [Hyphomicrobiales bacterium]